MTQSHMTLQNPFFFNSLIYCLLCTSQSVKHPCTQSEIIEEAKVYMTQGKTHLTWTKLGWDGTQEPSPTYTCIRDESELGCMAFLTQGAGQLQYHP